MKEPLSLRSWIRPGMDVGGTEILQLGTLLSEDCPPADNRFLYSLYFFPLQRTLIQPEQRFSWCVETVLSLMARPLSVPEISAQPPNVFEK